VDDEHNGPINRPERRVEGWQLRSSNNKLLEAAATNKSGVDIVTRIHYVQSHDACTKEDTQVRQAEPEHRQSRKLEGAVLYSYDK
jgi:hypothetical protein